MNESEPPEPRSQPEHDRSFAPLRSFLRLIRRPRDGDSLRETIDEMIEEPSAGGSHLLSAHERVLIGNILKVYNRTAADVMVPRVDIVALDVETSLSEVLKCMIEQGHSRVPVYRETLDDVIGFVHVKDLLGPAADRQPTKLGPILRKVLFVAPSLLILDLLVQMRQARTHIAMVVDEFGGIDGLVTIEDLIEEIVGEIRDEHDKADAVRENEHSYVVAGNMDVDRLDELFGIKPEGKESATVGGLVSELAGRIPQKGEVVEEDGLRFEVVESTERRVERVRITAAQPKQMKLI